MASSWMGNVRSFIGNSMGGLRGGQNVASWAVAGTIAYFLWIKPAQDLKKDQRARELLAVADPNQYVEKRKPIADPQDMSKAYDRVEWNLIEHLLRKLRFAERWIVWIMWCITSVKYKVLINGHPKGHIVPHRGLRQGDPLSPYLFILCTEILIKNLRKAEEMKQLTGLKVARASPAVSHLFFADDSLFFCKATREESEILLNLLRQYERSSGQQINFDKSSIQFGHKVEAGLRTEIHQVLGIKNIGGMGNYL